MRRLSQALFAFLQTVASAPGTDQLPRRHFGIGDLQSQEIATAIALRNEFFPVSSELKLVPDRLAQTATLKAAGFADSKSSSVGVDIAEWSRPCAPELDEIAWRRVFTWIVGTDTNLTNVSILEPPIVNDGRVSGTYGYDADGVPGYGVLHVTATEDGAWQICDCWGDAVDADRIDMLAGREAI